MRITRSLMLASLSATALSPLGAQVPAPQAPPAPAADQPPADAPPPDDPDADYLDEEEAIVITGQRPRGSVIGDIDPEITLDSRDIRAYGASDLAELLEALGPQVASGRGRGEGRPVILVNGQRISGFWEIRNYPPEAIERVDILPEEVALKYGYRADQRVVNFVLRPRFRIVTSELEGGIATDGGRNHYETDLTILRINRNGRWNLDFEYERDTALLESERDLVAAVSRPFDLVGNVGSSPPGGEIDPALSALLGEPAELVAVPAAALAGAPQLADFTNAVNSTDERPFRTLMPATEQFELAGTLNRMLFGNVSSTFNASLEQERRTSLFGLPSAELELPADNLFSPFASDVLLYRAFDELRPLTRNARTRTGHGGLAFNGNLDSWRWSLTANYDRVHSVTRTDNDPETDLIQQRIDSGDPAFNPFAPLGSLLVAAARDRTRSVDESGNAELVANGSLLALPAGDVSTTFKLGAEARGFESETFRDGNSQSRDLSRKRVDGQANVDLPIASRRDDVLAAIGDLSANANLAVEELSDFGTLITYGYGLNWEPFEDVRLIASVTEEEGAPSVQQLGNPVEAVPNVRVFDFVRGETVDITRIEGGNPNLRADNRRVTKLGLNIRPLEDTDLSFRVDYNRSRTRNLIASFPTATPEIEAAFPDRFQRDADGRLLSIDSRPVNFARAASQEIRWGFNFSKPIASRRGGGGGPGGWRARMQEAERRGESQPSQPGQAQPDQAQPAQPSDGASAPQPAQGTPGQSATPPTGEAVPGAREPGAGQTGGGRPGGAGFRGPGFGRGGQGQGGRLQLALYHSWRLQDEVLIRPGVPELDYLGGSAVGSRGGRPRHELELQAGIFKNGFGARLNANWQSGTTVRGDPLAGGGSGSSDLFFDDFATVNLRLFADLGQQPSLVRKHRWLRGLRLSLSVDNLLNNRLDVRDASGATPLSYQPAYLDPLGRSVQLQIRKLFYPTRRRRG